MFSQFALWCYVQSLYFPTILLCLCIFYSKINFRSNTARGKTSQQCEKEKDNASCIKEGSIKMACHPPYCRNRICPPQRCISRCPLLTIWWIPFDLPHWAQGHHSWVSHWNVSNVRIEPPLQPPTGKHLTLGSANREDGACPDIAADNFWGRDQNHAFLT